MARVQTRRPETGPPAPWRWIVGVVVAIVVVALASWLLIGRASTPAAAPVLAPAPSYDGHPTIDGIQCQNTEQIAYHIHAHLAIYVNGQPKAVPEGIGIAAPRHTTNTNDGPFVDGGACFYWLHTHTNDGVIHIESPSEQPYTLGNFFDEWQQPLSTNQAGPAQGQLHVYVNGTQYSGDPRQIQLAAHQSLQLNVGQDVAPQTFTFAPGL